MLISRRDVILTDLSGLVPRVLPGWCPDALRAPIGHHYRLCAYLGGLFSDSVLLDIGTAEGTSALAFALHAQSRGNRVVTCDVQDRRLWSLDGLPIEFRHAGANDPEILDCLEDARVVLVDIDHLAVEERRLYEHLREIDWRGLLVIDDIESPGSPQPLRAFWDSIDLPKFDLTEWCHHSGTGLVDFGCDVEIAG